MTMANRIAAVMHCTPEDDDDLVEAVRLLVAERDAAIAARDALAGAVREEREAERVFAERLEVPADPRASIDAMLTTIRATRSEFTVAAIAAAGDVALAARGRTDAALAATPVAMVRADVVRAYLDAVDARGSGELEDDRSEAARIDTARAALDAALAAAGGD